MGIASIFMVTLVVPEMNDAIDHYTRDWGFSLAHDGRHSSGHRWVEIDPGEGARLRLAEPRDDKDREVIGRQAGQSVAFFLRVGDFDRALAKWARSRITIVEPPRIEPYGRVAVVTDAFGNRWDVFDEEVGAKQDRKAAKGSGS